jgi:preprotein translocase subunit SecG
LWGSAALGLNLLTRLTTVLDVLAAGCFILLVLFFTHNKKPEPKEIAPNGKAANTAPNHADQPTVRTYLRTAVPIYTVFFLLDRIYQYIRFGSWTNTYVDIFSREQRQMDPSLPASFPFNGQLIRSGIDSGLLGPFLSPAKSIFLFDPMFVLALLLAVLHWKKLTPAVQAFLAATFVMLGAYIVFYARYFWWAGDFAWGDRYISSAVELTTLLAIPLLLHYRKAIGRTIWYAGLTITAASVVIQCASLAFWLPLEIYQMETFGPHTFIVPLRFKNIAAFALGRRAAWGLNTPAMFEDPWDAAHITTWNFLPSILRHISVAPLWAVHVLYAVWLLVAIALVFTAVRLVRALQQNEGPTQSSSAL